MIKATMKHAAIGAIQMEFNSFAELWEKAQIFSMPETCDICNAGVVPLFKNVTAGQGPRKGTKMKYYGLQCTGIVRHEYYLGIHNDDTRELFVYADRKFQMPYSQSELESAEYREKCVHCGTTNQYHAKTCPDYTETAQEARTSSEPAKVADSTPKPVSTPSEAPRGDSSHSGVPAASRTPIQVARDKFVRAVGDLGLSMGNTELAKMLKSMLGVDTVPSPLTPEHWITCYNLCNDYKTAAEIGGVNLDPNALAVMLCAKDETPGTRNIEDYNAAEWKAATQRAMEG